MRRRLDPATFNLPVGRIRAGYCSDAYFNSTKELLEAEGRHPRVLVQGNIVRGTTVSTRSRSRRSRR